jgi:hypothetical protein
MSSPSVERRRHLAALTVRRGGRLDEGEHRDAAAAPHRFGGALDWPDAWRPLKRVDRLLVP